ncbi:MAG TPA: SWIB/MDM2 domain-containing protein [Candidatus Udaeobacter sp.]|nr:SWIB/MDM2 domain-containing protein [Candidatus Udaeobacter sp.]
MPKTKKKTSKKKPAKRKQVQPDDKLAAIVGSQPLPRSELTKKLWSYIKKHGARDKKKRTMTEARLSQLLSKSDLTKIVSAHTDSPGPGRHRSSR